jgi:hypothetical protein
MGSIKERRVGSTIEAGEDRIGALSNVSVVSSTQRGDRSAAKSTRSWTRSTSAGSGKVDKSGIGRAHGGCLAALVVASVWVPALAEKLVGVLAPKRMSTQYIPAGLQREKWAAATGAAFTPRAVDKPMYAVRTEKIAHKSRKYNRRYGSNYKYIGSQIETNIARNSSKMTAW